MHSRSFGVRKPAEMFCKAILNAGGDAQVFPIYEIGILRGYRVAFCNHAPRWAREGITTPPLEFLLILLSEFDEPVRIQYLRVQMSGYSRDEQTAAIDKGKQLGLITVPASSRSLLTLELTTLARELESLASETDQPITA